MFIMVAINKRGFEVFQPNRTGDIKRLRILSQTVYYPRIIYNKLTYLSFLILSVKVCRLKPLYDFIVHILRVMSWTVYPSRVFIRTYTNNYI